MSDEFLSRHKEMPSAEFRESLRRRLGELDEGQESAPRPGRRLRPLVACAAGLLVALGLLGLPSVRAAARGFLDSFRLRSFAAIPVDPERLSQLQVEGLDLETLLTDSVEVLEEPGEPLQVETLEAAAEMAGIPVSVPSSLPEGATLEEILVGGRGLALCTLDTDRLEQLVELLEVEEVEVPHELHGLTIELETHRPVILTYRRDGEPIRLVQARSPRVTLPEPMDLQRLGRIGLQLAGMSAEEAGVFARSIDWGSTLLVPVPVNAATFREVEVSRSKGLLVTFLRRKGQPRGRGKWRSLLLWAEDERVFALEGRGQGMQVLRMAESMG